MAETSQIVTDFEALGASQKVIGYLMALERLGCITPPSGYVSVRDPVLDEPKGRASRNRVMAKSASAPGAKKSGAKKSGATKSGARINTKALVALVYQGPGITREKIIAEFPGSDSNIIGRVITGAMKTTKKRGVLLEMRNLGYYLTSEGLTLMEMKDMKKMKKAA